MYAHKYVLSTYVVNYEKKKTFNGFDIEKVGFWCLLLLFYVITPSFVQLKDVSNNEAIFANKHHIMF